MCLIIHKPAGCALPDELLQSAAAFNPHGFGIVSFGHGARARIRRRQRTDIHELERQYRAMRDDECVFHLRYGTHGATDLGNTHPLRVTSHIHLFHNGTLRVERADPRRSDTWYLIEDYLRPILRRRPGLLHEQSFSELLLAWAGPNNRFVFVDTRARRTVIVNREAGFELDGIWLSNLRWFDASRFAWHPATRSAPPPRTLAFAL